MDFPAAQESFHLGPHFLNKVFFDCLPKVYQKRNATPCGAGGCVSFVFSEVYQKSTKVTFCPENLIKSPNLFVVPNFFAHVRTVILAY